MKRLLLFLICAVLGASIFHFVSLLKAKSKYDEATGFFQKASFTSATATEKDDQFIAEITQNWDKHPATGISSEELEHRLKLAGFPYTLDGLVDFQTHLVPPFSYFDQGRNKKEVVRAAVMNIGSPIFGKGVIVSSEKYVYHQQPSGLINLFLRTKDGIRHTVLTKPLEASLESAGDSKP